MGGGAVEIILELLDWSRDWGLWVDIVPPDEVGDTLAGGLLLDKEHDSSFVFIDGVGIILVTLEMMYVL